VLEKKCKRRTTSKGAQRPCNPWNEALMIRFFAMQDANEDVEAKGSSHGDGSLKLVRYYYFLTLYSMEATVYCFLSQVVFLVLITGNAPRLRLGT
jgi:hypothetical protein